MGEETLPFTAFKIPFVCEFNYLALSQHYRELTQHISSMLN